MAIAATLIASLLLSAADSPTAAPDVPPPPPPPFARVNNGPGEIHLTFEEKSKTRDILIRRGAPGEKETILIDGKPAKNATLEIQQRRRVLANAGNRQNGPVDVRILEFRSHDLDDDEAFADGDSFVIQRFSGGKAPDAQADGGPKIRRFAFRSDGNGAWTPRGRVANEFCKETDEGVTCLFPKNGLVPSPEDDSSSGKAEPGASTAPAKPGASTVPAKP